MKKILIIENSLYVTGGLNAILATTERLKTKFEFHFIIPEQSIVENIISSKGYTVTKLPFLEISRSFKTIWYLPRLYQNARRIIQYMQSQNINILHVNDIFNMVGCMVKKLEPSITLINHVRLLKSSYISPLYPFFAKQLKKYADQIICVSEAVKKDINNGANVQVIYDCPDVTEKYPPWDGLHNPNTLKILYLGNYIPGKGHDLGLQAFTIFHQFFPKATLTFAGASNTDASRQFKEMLISKAAEARIDQCVIFEDSVSDVEYEMKAYDIVLNLSESESFSFVCLEAMLYGVPLVAANSGGPAEITDYGKKAILVENKNPVAASEGLKKIANATVVYREMAANAQRWAAKRFDAFKETEKLTLIYKTIT